MGSILGFGRSPERGHSNPLQYSCLENPMNRGAFRLQSMGSQRVRHDLGTKTTTKLQLIKVYYLRKCVLLQLCKESCSFYLLQGMGPVILSSFTIILSPFLLDNYHHLKDVPYSDLLKKLKKKYQKFLDFSISYQLISASLHSKTF